MAPITSANKHQTHYLIANGNFTTEVNNKMANLCYKIIGGGRSRASPDAPASGRCVEVNCTPRPAPHMQTPTPPMFQPPPSCSFPPAFPCCSWPPCGHALSPRTHTLRAKLHLHIFICYFSIYFDEGSPVPGIEVIIKASLAPVDSAVRVVWSPRSGKSPSISYLQNTCVRE